MRNCSRKFFGREQRNLRDFLGSGDSGARSGKPIAQSSLNCDEQRTQLSASSPPDGAHCVNVLGTDADSHHSSYNSLQAWNAGNCLKLPRRFCGSTHLEDSRYSCVREHLDLLRDARRELAPALNQGEREIDGLTCTQIRSDNAGSGDGVLNGEIDANASGWRHGVGGIADAQEAWTMPPLEAINLYGQQLDLSPIRQLFDPITEVWRDLANCAAEGLHALPANFIQRPFADQQPGLEVITAIDQDQSLAVIDIAKELIGIGLMAANAEPKHVDGDAALDLG